MKGASSHAWNRAPTPTRLRWQDGYWAESVAPSQIAELTRYIVSQRVHHIASPTAEPWESPLKSPPKAGFVIRTTVLLPQASGLEGKAAPPLSERRE